jgi:hypothetical protein
MDFDWTAHSGCSCCGEQHLIQSLDEITLRRLQRVALSTKAAGDEPPFVTMEEGATVDLADNADAVADDIYPRLIKAIEHDPFDRSTLRLEVEIAEQAWRERAWPGSLEEALSALYGDALDAGDGALATTRISFLERMRMVNGMLGSTKYYTNEYFNTQVMPAVIDAVDAATVNQGRNAAIDAIRQVLDRRLHSVPYWNIVANAAVSRSYHYGLIHSGVRAGYRFVQFSAVRDDKTSQICLDMDGKQWSAMDLLNLVDRMAQAGVAELKRMAPWVKPAEIAGKTETELLDMGVCIPPLHGHCRSQLTFVV